MSVQNSRYATLFHLLVPVRKWQTVITRSMKSANFYNSYFHSRIR
jgi:hypothetical protein